MTEKIWIGTSGYSYPEWRGSFYPEEMPTGEMLAFYSARLASVEINNTFYRMPSDKILKGWAEATPDGFVFTLKASRRITHKARLKDCADLLEYLCERARTLGQKLGVLLFQLPPWARKDLEVLDEFFEAMPPDIRAAFEFRHESWLSEDVYSRLRAKNLALCVSDSEKSTTPVVATADYGYFRLRDEGYGPDDVARWADTIDRHSGEWRDVFVYFKHEKSGKGAELAQSMMTAFERG